MSMTKHPDDCECLECTFERIDFLSNKIDRIIHKESAKVIKLRETPEQRRKQFKLIVTKRDDEHA